ncbi:MAG: phosphotransferase [Pseudomonadota bacterium]
MAAFTTFSEEALARFLVMFELYENIVATPIETGIENSNYRIQADGGHYVLTITETLDFGDTAFFNEIFDTLSRTGVPTPIPLRTLDGMASTIFCGKPTWLFSHLPGQHTDESNTTSCRQVGRALATIHVSLSDARYHRANPYDLAWSEKTFSLVEGLLNEVDAKNVSSAIDTQRDLLRSGDELPQGTIHGDLFRDNTLFDDGQLTGVLDFYHACDDYLIMDLAVAINDWCPDDTDLQEHLLSGYDDVRVLSVAERQFLPSMRQVAAMRFALTRLTSGEPGQPLKDPTEFLSLLTNLSNQGQ